MKHENKVTYLQLLLVEEIFVADMPKCLNIELGFSFLSFNKKKILLLNKLRAFSSDEMELLYFMVFIHTQTPTHGQRLLTLCFCNIGDRMIKCLFVQQHVCLYLKSHLTNKQNV